MMKDKGKHEKRSGHEEIVRDVIIGFADGLTVPFALTAGLSSYVPTPSPVALTQSLLNTYSDWDQLIWWSSVASRNSSAARSPWDLELT